MKRIMLLVVCSLLFLLLVSCGNQQFFDTTYTFNYAILELPNGKIIEGRLDSWRDYEGDSIQIVINGDTYYAHMMNVVMTTRTYLE